MTRPTRLHLQLALVALLPIGCASDLREPSGLGHDDATSDQVTFSGSSGGSGGAPSPEPAAAPASGVAAADRTFRGIALADATAGIRARIASASARPDPAALRVLEHDGAVLALSAAQPAALASSTRAWRGRELRVLTSSGAVCAGRVTELSTATPWIARHDLGAPGESARAIDFADPFWGADLVAEVALDDPGACRGDVLLVQDAAQPAPRLARGLRGVPQRARILEAFRALPEYLSLRQQCAEDPLCGKDPETGLAPEWPLQLGAYRFPGERTIYVTASLPAGHCGEFGPGMAAIFRLQSTDDPDPELYRVHADEELGRPALLLDVERDGSLELLTSRSFASVELLDEHGAARLAWTPVFVGCGC